MTGFQPRAGRVPARRPPTPGAARVLPGGLRAAFFLLLSGSAGARLRAIILLSVAIAACSTQRLQPGPAADRALVRANPVLSAGLPVQVRLRQVDGRKVSWHVAAADLPAGRHRLLVDCRIAATGTDRRFALEVELAAGREYRLVARTSARDCAGVELVPR